MKKVKFLIVLILFITTSVWSIELEHVDLKMDLAIQGDHLLELENSNVDSAIVEEPQKETTAEDYTYDEISKIKNDKEVVISFMWKEEIQRIKRKFSNIENNKNIINQFTSSLHSFLNKPDSHCEVSLISELVTGFENSNIAKTKEEALDVFKMLRLNNEIDDIMYEILEYLVSDYYSMGRINLTVKPIRNIFKDYNKKSEGYDLVELFKSFKSYPNESDSCAYVEYFKIRNQVGNYKDTISSKNNDVKDLAYIAYTKNILSLENYNKLNFLSQKSNIQERQIWLNDYLKIIFSAKNKMIPKNREYEVVKLDQENPFSTEMISRFSKVTRRKLLYRKYNEDQIIMIAQVMKKASQRMGVDADTKTSTPYLIQEFNILNQAGTAENYVERIELDTQDQFNLARKLLRKDMVALQMMETFQKVVITYEDLVMASLETGYISLDDLDYVTKYDELWNPKVSKFDRLMSMTFRVAGYATFFLPPPWNVTAALSLAIIDGIVDSKNINGASNDNPNTFIE